MRKREEPWLSLGKKVSEVLKEWVKVRLSSASEEEKKQLSTLFGGSTLYFTWAIEGQADFAEQLKLYPKEEAMQLLERAVEVAANEGDHKFLEVIFPLCLQYEVKGQTAAALIIAEIKGGGSLEKIRELIKLGGFSYWNEVRIFEAVITLKQAEIVAYLLKAGLNPYPPYEESFDALSQAVEGGDALVVQALLEGGIDPDRGEALKKAVEQGKVEIASLLLSSGADPDLGRPIEEAVALGNEQMVRLLIEARASIGQDESLIDKADATIAPILKEYAQSFLTKEQSTHLLVAVKEGDLETVERLLSSGRPLLQEERECLEAAVTSGSYPIIEQLLRVCGSANASIDGKKLVELVKSIKKEEKVSLLKLLIDYGAKVQAYEVSHSLIEEAIEMELMPMLELLLTGNRLTGPSERLAQLVIGAATKGNMPMIRRLVEAGVEINLQDAEGNDVLSQAIISGHYELVEPLLSMGATVKLESLKNALAAGASDTLERLLLKAEAEVFQGESGGQLLIEAAKYGNLKLIEKLLDSGVDLDTYGIEAVEEACAKGEVEVVLRLIEKGVEIASDMGLFSKMLEGEGSVASKVSLTKLLLDQGVQVDAMCLAAASAIDDPETLSLLVDSALQDPLDEWRSGMVLIAIVQGGNGLLLKKALDKGLDPHATNFMQQSGIATAQEMGRDDLVQVFLDR